MGAARNAGDQMAQFYSNPNRMLDEHALPDIEVFFISEREASESRGDADAEGGDPVFTEAGYYWWTCFPGCLPDGDPNGPFPTMKACVDDFTQDPEDD